MAGELAPARPADRRSSRSPSISIRRMPCSTARARRSRWPSAPRYSDGTDRDVTSPLALFLSNNDTSAKISPERRRHRRRPAARPSSWPASPPSPSARGEVIVLPKGQSFTFPPAPENNYIDTLVNAKLQGNCVSSRPAFPTDEDVSAARLSTDVIGVLPTVEEYQPSSWPTPAVEQARACWSMNCWAARSSPSSWVMKWAELLQIRSSNQVSYKAMLLYYNWLQDKIARNVPVNEWVQEALAASGGTFKKPATNYYQDERDVLKVSEKTPPRCSWAYASSAPQCHLHPFDRWTQGRLLQLHRAPSSLSR